ncbi:hypothetical protein HJC23_013603 [Cyclotella cryptica]|uniref:Uncharacterized protein n=1 Tax=Cyclotella cryptica TaxID=29204 RepID=A0ABD3PQ87_9STRA
MPKLKSIHFDDSSSQNHRLSIDEGKSNDAIVVGNTDETLSFETPTQKEIELWEEVCDLLNRNQRVDVTKAIQSIHDASHYCKGAMYSKEARSFIDSCMPRIVSILVQNIDLGDTDVGSSENAHVKSCLEVALEIVSNDLAAASVADCECKTLSVLTDIFDEVMGVQDADHLEMRRKFEEANGFCHLGWYLSTKAEGRDTLHFPQIDTIYTILDVVKKSKSSCGCSEDDALVISDAVMLHLCCLDETQLIRLDSDSIEICNLVHEIYHDATILRGMLFDSFDRNLFHYFDFKRAFILKLIRTSSAPLKLLGWTELRAIIEQSAEKRPLPRAIVVDGAGLEEVNGIYEVDPKLVATDGRLKRNHVVSYVKRAPLSNEGVNEDGADSDEQIVLSPWNIFRLVGGKKEFLYRSRAPFNSNRRPPKSGWRIEKGARPSPAVKSVGLLLLTGDESTLEHDLVEWIFCCDVFKVVLEDLASNNEDVRSEAKKAIQSMMESIGQFLDFLIDIIPEQAEKYKVGVNDVEKALDIVNLIMKYFVSMISRPQWEGIGRDFVTATCEQLKKIHERFSTLFPQCVFDFFVFHRVLILGFLMSSSPSKIEIGQKELIRLEQTSIIAEGSINCATTAQPNMSIIVQQLLAAAEMSNVLQEHQLGDGVLNDDNEKVATDVKQILKRCLKALDTENLNSLHTEFVRSAMEILVRIYARTVNGIRQSTSDYHDFCRVAILKLITSSNHMIAQDGWVSLSQLLRMSIADRPPPRTYIVESRQRDNLNGVYEIDVSQLTEEGWLRDETNIRYVKNVVLDHDDDDYDKEHKDGRKNGPESADYFILERTATNDQIEFSFYTGDSRGHLHSCGETEFSYSPDGLAVPEGEEFKTPELELAKWAIKNTVIEKAYENGIPSEAAANCIMELIDLITSICDNETGENRPITNMLTIHPQDRSKLSNSCRKRKWDMTQFHDHKQRQSPSQHDAVHDHQEMEESS